MVKVVDLQTAVGLISDGNTLWIGGSGGGHAIPEKLIEGLEERFLTTGSPRNLTIAHAVALGDWKDKGASRLARPGLVKRSIAGGYNNSPQMGQLAAAGEIEAYTFPQGTLSQLTREMAGGRPGLITHVGLHTFVDPRVSGGRQGPKKGPDLVEVVNLGGREYLFYKSIDVDVAFIRATTADERGNLTMEKEAFFGENISIAQAVHRRGGVVIAQVERLAAAGTLPGKQVKVPGILVDYVVVDPDPWQTYVTKYDPAYAGELRKPTTNIPTLPLDERKVIARRAAQELYPGAVVNLGFGVANGIAFVAAEERIFEKLALTVEQGLIGGVTALGNDAGAGVNYDAMIDQPYQFDFYDGGGLDMAFLSFAEVDQAGCVNVSKFGDRVGGPGGFINISQNAKKVFFLGTLTGGGLKVVPENGGLRVVQEGRLRKFVPEVNQITWSGPFALRRGQPARYITERAVFELTPEGLALVEVAAGIDIRRDIMAQVGFRITVPREPMRMDSRLFGAEPVGLANEAKWNGRQ